MHKNKGNAAEATTCGSTQNVVKRNWKDDFQNLPWVHPFFAYNLDYYHLSLYWKCHKDGPNK